MIYTGKTIVIKPVKLPSCSYYPSSISQAIKTPNNGILIFFLKGSLFRVYDIDKKAWHELSLDPKLVANKNQFWGIVENMDYAPNASNNP